MIYPNFDKDSKVFGYSPQFSQYIDSIKAFGGVYSYFLLDDKENYRFHYKELLENMRPEHCMLYIGNPNNPTAQIIPITKLKIILEKAHRLGICVIIDEAFSDFMQRDNSAISLINKYDNLFDVRTFSKGFGLAGLRIGYVCCNNKLMKYYLIIQVTIRGKIMFKNAILRRPGSSMVNGIPSEKNLGKPDFDKTLVQHDEYVASLRQCGISIKILEADERYPDSCFVEDVAVLTKKCAVITNPGAESRKGEEIEMVGNLKEFYNNVEYIRDPGTLEGGDVMMIGDHFFIGLSGRTNLDGASQLIDILKHYGYSGSTVVLDEMLHLKTGLAYLEDNILLITGEFIEKDQFNSFQKIIIPDEEGYAANCIRVNDFVIVPTGYEKTKKAIEDTGLKTLDTDVSEFRKLNAGLSCLSLRF